MSYRIAGVDVHKKILAVVVSDVEVEGEYKFERRMYSLHVFLVGEVGGIVVDLHAVNSTVTKIEGCHKMVQALLKDVANNAFQHFNRVIGRYRIGCEIDNCVATRIGPHSFAVLIATGDWQGSSS